METSSSKSRGWEHFRPSADVSFEHFVLSLKCPDDMALDPKWLSDMSSMCHRYSQVLSIASSIVDMYMNRSQLNNLLGMYDVCQILTRSTEMHFILAVIVQVLVTIDIPGYTLSHFIFHVSYINIYVNFYVFFL